MTNVDTRYVVSGLTETVKVIQLLTTSVKNSTVDYYPSVLAQIKPIYVTCHNILEKYRDIVHRICTGSEDITKAFKELKAMMEKMMQEFQSRGNYNVY